MGYEAYCLTDNPFPKGGAFVKPESDDPRDNGSIFSVNARKAEIDEFEKKLVGSKVSFDDRTRCGFLWAHGGRTIGRGMGKTALTLYMLQKINKGYGKNYFGGKTKFFCSYISFQKQIKARVVFLYKEALRSFIKSGLFAEVQKSTTEEQLKDVGVNPDYAHAIASGNVKSYFKSISRYTLGEMLTQWDTKFIGMLPELFMEETVSALKAAGFAGGILVIDDMENLTDVATRAEIETFVKDFGIAFFRSRHKASTSNFFTTLFVAHEQSANDISQAWTLEGLASAYPLTPGGEASILTRKPDMEQCLDIFLEHLKYCRDSKCTDSDPFFPFDKEAVEWVINDTEYHPRKFLSRFNRIIVNALGEDAKKITLEMVKASPKGDEDDEASSSPGIQDL